MPDTHESNRPSQWLALLVAVVATIFSGRRASLIAAWLLVPYAAWVAFATALNAAIVVLN